MFKNLHLQTSYEKKSTIPTPKAMARAEKIASIPLDNPDRKSPDMVSLIALVMATPGTKGIMEPIITLSRLSPKPNLMRKYDKILMNTEPMNLSRKKVSFNLEIELSKNETMKLTIKAPKKSRIVP